jgi:LDH2 family malate/lactate/ureidoglycolate dehydrogenase
MGMPVVQAERLSDFTRLIFEAHGVRPAAAAVVAESLVLGNLKGHDSHGVIRVLEYVDWLARVWTGFTYRFLFRTEQKTAANFVSAIQDHAFHGRRCEPHSGVHSADRTATIVA